MTVEKFSTNSRYNQFISNPAWIKWYLFSRVSYIFWNRKKIVFIFWQEADLYHFLQLSWFYYYCVTAMIKLLLKYLKIMSVEDIFLSMFLKFCRTFGLQSYSVYVFIFSEKLRLELTFWVYSMFQPSSLCKQLHQPRSLLSDFLVSCL